MEDQDKLFSQYKNASGKAEDKGFDRMEAVWNRVEEKLERRKERKAAAWWKYSGIAAILILFVTISTFMFNDDANTINPQGVPTNSVTTIDTAKIKTAGGAVKQGLKKQGEVVVNEHSTGPINYGSVRNSEAVSDAGAETAPHGEDDAPSHNDVRAAPTGDVAETAKSKVAPFTGPEKVYTGVVLDSDGSPLPGATVMVKGTTVGVQTDIDGGYSIVAPEGSALVYSFVGMSEKTISTTGSTTVDITMTEDNYALNEVVVENYRTTTKRSAVASTAITSETIEGRPNSNLIQSLEGRVPGLQINSGKEKTDGEQSKENAYDNYMYENYYGTDAEIAKSAGQPGTGSRVVLRGMGSITENKEPLYIIDGVPGNSDNVKSIDPENIIDMAVLKDAAATSIYGNRGANGVILITTKDKKLLTKRQQRKLERANRKIEKQQQKPMETIKFTVKDAEQPVEKVQIDQEEYESFIENQFENPATAPLSTFSIDVDNASYTNVRRFLNNGQVVPKDAVRVEEMINFFKYKYPQPKGNAPFSINTEYSDAPWNPKHKLVRIGLQGKELATNNLPASNFVFLIDVSGSMEEANKLPLLKQSMKLLVKQMRRQDKIAIVVYAGAAGLVLPPTSGTDITKIYAALDDLEAGGSTAGGAGIELAYKTAAENFVKAGNNRVIIATDGDFNVGASSDKDMQALIEEKRKTGIFLTCLGYGMGNYKDSKLETLADKGNGNYAYIDNMQEADRFLQKEFRGSMYAIAKDVKIQIEFNPKHVQSYRLIGYENRKLRDEDFANDSIDAGELGSGHTVTALYEIIPVGVKSDFFINKPELKYSTPQTAAGNYNDELATIKFRHKKPGEDVSTETVEVIANKSIPLKKASGDYKFSAAVAWFGLKLRDSKLVPDKDTKDISELAKQGLAEDPDGYRAEFVRLVNRVE